MGYYAEKLSGDRLRQCYKVAPPRVSQYLEAEIGHVIGRLRPSDRVLELGCGYGRVAHRLAEAARHVVGIDTAGASLQMARDLAGGSSCCRFLCMDALHLGFAAGEFDVVVCIQNGICVFGADHGAVLREALRVTRLGGILLFSTYADRFWDHRLAWFQAQAVAGLIGPIDHAASTEGVIVCRDGFRASRLAPGEWRELCAHVGVEPMITEVDGSSLFCEIVSG